MAPLFLERLERALGEEERAFVDLVEEDQLHAELALQLDGRERVLLVGADPQAAPPFSLQLVLPGSDASLSSPVLSAPALLAVYREFHGREPPPLTLMGLQAHRFGSGRQLSAEAEEALPGALLWALGWIDGDSAEANLAPDGGFSV